MKIFDVLPGGGRNVLVASAESVSPCLSISVLDWRPQVRDEWRHHRERAVWNDSIIVDNDDCS